MNSTRLTSAITTLLLVVIFLIVLYKNKLELDPTKPYPPEPSPYIAMEYIEVEVEPEDEIPPIPQLTGDEASAPAQTPEDMDNPSELAPPTGVSLNNNGPKAEETPKTVTSTRPSTVKNEKTEKTDKPAGPPVDTQKKKDEATARAIQNVGSDAFKNANAKGNTNDSDGDQGNSGKKNGDPNSNGPHDSKSTHVGITKGNLARGWGWPAKIPTPKSTELGSVTLELTLNPDGSVANVKSINSKGLTDKTIRPCIDAAYKMKFTAPQNAEIGTTARLTFTYTDPK